MVGKDKLRNYFMILRHNKSLEKHGITSFLKDCVVSILPLIHLYLIFACTLKALIECDGLYF